jgi:hypothetical protein
MVIQDNLEPFFGQGVTLKGIGRPSRKAPLRH